MRVLITGAGGFIGRHLAIRLAETGVTDVREISRETSADTLRRAVADVDFVFHLAGVNRPKQESEFQSGNADFTASLCRELAAAANAAPIVFSSSTQAALDNAYGRSKRAAEDVLRRHSETTGAAVTSFRLTNVFGKWSRPNYNSAVATFCHQVARGQAPTIHDPKAALRLVYVDDVVNAFAAVLKAPGTGFHEASAGPAYETSVGEVAGILKSFAESRSSLVTPRVGSGLVRALHATYLSFLPPADFAYSVPRHGDPRGEFVEMLKTEDSGQFSYFTAHPGITRGEHYHHSKTEKFLVIRGTAHFGFRHIVTGETFEITCKGGEARIVETAPGWAHNITNVGTDELIVMLWANEIFDRSAPDTYARKVAQ